MQLEWHSLDGTYVHKPFTPLRSHFEHSNFTLAQAIESLRIWSTTSLHFSHVTREYFTSVMKWVRWFVSIFCNIFLALDRGTSANESSFDRGGWKKDLRNKAHQCTWATCLLFVSIWTECCCQAWWWFLWVSSITMLIDLVCKHFVNWVYWTVFGFVPG